MKTVTLKITASVFVAGALLMGCLALSDLQANNPAREDIHLSSQVESNHLQILLLTDKFRQISNSLSEVKVDVMAIKQSIHVLNARERLNEEASNR